MSILPKVLTQEQARQALLGQQKGRGRNVVHVAGEMNRQEALYAQNLDGQKVLGLIRAWKFEAIRMRLASGTHYVTDFLVITPDYHTEIHEVKGHWEDDARVKIKVAAEQFPFYVFRALRFDGGRWHEETWNEKRKRA